MRLIVIILALPYSQQLPYSQHMNTAANQRKSPFYLLAGLIVLKMVLHYCIINPVYELHRDEYLYLDMANHLAGGYLSVPPFIAFVSLLVKALDNGLFWIRFFPAMSGAITLVLIWRLVALLQGRWYAQVLAATVFIFSGFLRLNMLYQPNSFDVLCWTWTFYLLVCYVNTEKHSYLLWLGVAVGLGFLNKYNILFLVAGLVPAVLISPQRKIFLNRYLYLGAGIALLLALPNIIWQLRNGMPVLHHMQELTQTQLVYVQRMDFIKAQFIFFFTGGFLFVAGLIGLLCYRPFGPYRFLVLTYLFVILLFTYLRAKDYYALGLYPVLLAFGAVYWETLFRAAWLRHMRVIWLLLVIVPFLYLFNIVFPVLKPAAIQQKAAKFKAAGLLRWEDGKNHALPQDFADMLGWREMAALSRRAYAQVPDSDKPYTLIMCGNYGQAGALNYYNHGRIPLASSFNADYVFWFPRMDTLRYVILLDDEPDERAHRYSGRITEIGRVQNPLAREYGTAVYLLQQLSPELPARLKEWRKERIQAFRRY